MIVFPIPVPYQAVHNQDTGQWMAGVASVFRGFVLPPYTAKDLMNAKFPVERHPRLSGSSRMSLAAS